METVRVEGFNSSLRGRKFWIVGDEQFIANRLHVVEQELLGRGRKVLIIADGRNHMPRWSKERDWDAVFRIKDANDLRLALTYLTNGTKPLRVVWLGDEPAPVLQSKLPNDLTFFGFGTSHPRNDWDGIFFSGQLDAHRIEEALLSRMGSSRLAQLNLKSVVPEIRAAKAGLVWSSIDETEKAGSVYWYDIAEGEAPEKVMNMAEAAEFLREIADRIASAK
jgi:hypothetical protein